jgi:hypothetical protein
MKVRIIAIAMGLYPQMKSLNVLLLIAIALLALPTPSSAQQFAVWLDGNTSPSTPDGILSSLDNAFGTGHWTIVSTSNLETAGFLNSFDTLIMSRDGSSFGTTSISATAIVNISAYVGSGPTQGGVALFTNDAKDNFFGAGSGDPFDPNLDRLFVNSATFASASHHGFIGEFNGTVIGLNQLHLLPGVAGDIRNYGPQFVYDVGPIGSANPIDAGVTFPFTDSDDTTFLTDVTGADPNNIVDIYTSADIQGEPAVLANKFVVSGGVPEGSTLLYLGVGLPCVVGLGFHRRRLSIART